MSNTKINLEESESFRFDIDDTVEEEKDGEENNKGTLLDRYNQSLDSNPVLTKAITAAFVQGIGSILGQLLSSSPKSSSHKMNVRNVPKHEKRIDWMDVIAFALHGGIMNGPVGHYWFEYLSKHGPKSKSYSMLLDQLVVQPPLLVLMFIFLDCTKQVLREIKPSYARTMSVIGPTIVTSWRFWPLAVYCT
mmetsp:Transcript_4737/g.7135  ORF Transcript_4737/g.7135 Transcript_4737/m.7135 type:complete len:191 (+) Transcript_4737:110-682(+)